MHPQKPCMDARISLCRPFLQHERRADTAAIFLLAVGAKSPPPSLVRFAPVVAPCVKDLTLLQSRW